MKHREILGIALIFILAFCIWRISLVDNYKRDNEVKIGQEQEAEPMDVFYTNTIEVIELKDTFRIEDYYITNRVNSSNRYYIDDNKVLWGYGNNEYGQLGNDAEKDTMGAYRIADEVISVDASSNGYFCIFLTADGSLYGMGENICGLLDTQEDDNDRFPDGEIITEPVLLMEDVAYARAGKESVVALQKDGSVCWWGQYRSTYATMQHENADILYWKTEEDEENPLKMLYRNPRKILENCIYAVTGNTTGAAIGQNGELYTWGLNIFGECACPVTGLDYIREPQQVLENVKMVWVEQLMLNSPEKRIPDPMSYDTVYDFNIFVQQRDGIMLAAGEGIGTKEKQCMISGDLQYATEHVYSDSFIPIAVREYSEENIRSRMTELLWGMNETDVKNILRREGIPYAQYDYGGKAKNELAVNGDRYTLYFDTNGKLNQIYYREGGSRNLQYEIGMTREEIESRITCSYDMETSTDNPLEIRYNCNEMMEGSYYCFLFYVDRLVGIIEKSEL